MPPIDASPLSDGTGSPTHAGPSLARLSSGSEFARYQQQRIGHWNEIARRSDTHPGCGGYYHERLGEIYSLLVPPGQRVLEVGCGRGDLLAALAPAYGVGIDFSEEMIGRARRGHPNLRFICEDIHEVDLAESFDVIVLSDIINDLWDIMQVFATVKSFAIPRTRFILNSYSKLWELPLAAAAKLGLALPTLRQNWLSTYDIVNLLHLAGLEPIRLWQETLWPLRTPVVAAFANRFAVKLWPFRYFALTNFIVARLQPQQAPDRSQPLVSVIVPARNEAGNISSLLARVPEMGRGTEIVFVEGHSDDSSYEVIEQEMRAHPERRCQLHRQSGVGKGDAVRLALDRAQGDIAIVLDADLSVPPEILPRFVELLQLGRGEFVNGVRLVYPMEDEAMRFFNLLGNKLFCWVFSWLLGQPIKDTLCGTKALWKADHDRIMASRLAPAEFDPFGDFELLFGAAKLGLKIVDCPVRYQARTYGSTNIRRWRHGWMLLQMVLFAARRLKFV